MFSSLRFVTPEPPCSFLSLLNAVYARRLVGFHMSLHLHSTMITDSVGFLVVVDVELWSLFIAKLPEWEGASSGPTPSHQ